jgi:hypothetical protein
MKAAPRNLADLTHRAREIRRHPITHQSRAELETLRSEAAHGGVAAAFDATLTALFRDVYGGKPPPTQSITSMGGVPFSAGAGGKKGSPALSFHGMREPAAIAKALTSRLPELKTITPTPVPLDAQFKPLSGFEKREAREALTAELSAIPVKGSSGERVTLLEKLQGAGLDSERLLDVLAQVKVGYERVSVGTGNKPLGYQTTNWKHTRLEVDRALDAARLGGLTPHETEVALLASFLSDSVKAPSNFLVHNVHGAQAAVMVLSRLVPPPSAEMIEDVVKATLEHQIGPPGFMGNVAMRGALNGAHVDKELVDSICAKVSKPFENVTEDKTQIAFTDPEKRALEKIGIFAWTVPHEGSRHYKAARAVIDADSLVNYSCPDGWAKLAELHGPGQPPFLQEPRFVDGLLSELPQHASAYKSFVDARAVVSPGSLAMYDGGRARTLEAIDRVMTKLTAWAEAQPNVPKNADGTIPYLDGPLDYSMPTQVDFARSLREVGAKMLREEEVANP